MSEQWDEFSKSLSEPVPRRESFRRLGAVFAGALFGSLGLKNAVGAPKTDPCTTFCKCANQQQKKACVAACRDCNSDPRFLCGNCSGGYACADLANDPWNCGACFNECGGAGAYEYAACNNGRCEYHCVSGGVRCNGTCTVLADDPSNCGVCGNTCEEPGPYEYRWCENGQCEYECYEGADYCNGTCTFLNWDIDNCGACGNACGEQTPFCNQGQCSQCHGSLAMCGGRCVDLAFDNQNCGVCGVVCAGDMTCVAGVCQVSEPCWNCGV